MMRVNSSYAVKVRKFHTLGAVDIEKRLTVITHPLMARKLITCLPETNSKPPGLKLFLLGIKIARLFSRDGLVIRFEYSVALVLHPPDFAFRTPSLI
jgi:hypothetical protein